MTGADLHMLAGAYALWALDEEERRAFEAHLDQCDSCRTEVGEFQATAARLAQATGEAPPPAMKQQVLHRAAQVRQEPPKVVPAVRRGRRAAPARRAYAFVLAASVAAAAALGGVAVWQYQDAHQAHQQATQAQADAQQIAAVLSAPDARTVSGTVNGRTRAVVVESHSQNRAVFITPGLPALPDNKVYQLWYDDAGSMRPAGLVTPGTADQTVLLTGAIGPAQGMGVTVEPAGGSLHPTSTPIALMAFPPT